MVVFQNYLIKANIARTTAKSGDTENHRLTVHLELNTAVRTIVFALIFEPCVVPSCDVSSLALTCRNKIAESSS